MGAPLAHGPVHAEVALPGSKSLTNRALVLAALADGPSVVRRALRSRDTELMAGALVALGASIDTSGDDWHVEPGPMTGGGRVDCGLAGTVTRFVPPVAGLADGAVAFDGDPHMRTRPVGEVLSALRALGVDVAGDRLPFTVRGTGHVRGGRVVLDASGSSQFVSALLLAGARFDEGLDLLHDGKAGPVAATHRDDRCHAPTARRGGRRRRSRTAGGSPPGRSGRSTTPSSPTSPTPRPSWPWPRRRAAR